MYIIFMYIIYTYRNVYIFLFNAIGVYIMYIKG